MVQRLSADATMIVRKSPLQATVSICRFHTVVSGHHLALFNHAKYKKRDLTRSRCMEKS